MDRPQRRFDAEHDDQPLDLAPAAVMQVVADIAARLGPVGRLQTCGLAKPVDQPFGFNDIAGFDIERQVHKGGDLPVIIGWQTDPGDIGLSAPLRLGLARRRSVKAIG